MGWFRFHRSKKIFPGVRLNISKSGIGFSFGRKGMRYSIGPKGTSRMTLGIPGTGLSYISTSGKTTPSVSASSSLYQPNSESYDTTLILGNDAFYRLAQLADKNPKRAVMIYNTVVGFVSGDESKRICKETGEVYTPSKNQLALEAKLLDIWKRYQITERRKLSISPWVYLLLSSVFGVLAFHRLAVSQKKEGMIRIALALFALLCLPKLFITAIWIVCIAEGLFTLFLAERDEDGMVIPLGILDIIPMLVAGE